MTSKYDALAEYLSKIPGDSIKMTFDEIESIVGELPKAARTYRAWWSNNTSFTHARNGWLAAGWKTALVGMDGRRLTFIRGSVGAKIGSPPASTSGVVSPTSQELLDDIADQAGGRDNLVEILRAVKRYVQGEIVETELGRVIRKLWNKGA
jgi:hypothetical protein